MTRDKRIRKLVKDEVCDLVADFLYYDRKDDEELEMGMIQEGIAHKAITTDEIVALFRDELTKALARNPP